MFKKVMMTAALALSIALPISTLAASSTYTVVKGDTLWKIAVKNQVGLSELISLNPNIANPDLIYPGQKIIIAQN